MTESTNNKSFVPLLSGRVYIGSYDSVAPYATATVSLLTDTTCQLVANQSQNRVQQNVTSYNTVAGVQFTLQLDLTNPFVYFTIRNTSVHDGTLMAFTVIYRSGQIIPPSILPVRGSQSLWTVSSSTAIPIDLSTQSVRTLTIFGTSNAGMVISVLFSNDNVTWFQSQYQYTLSGGDFGFSINACPYYLQISSNNPENLLGAFINYS